MRFKGRIKTWNEARGFGFISPMEGGTDVFVHISALPDGRAPTINDLVTYEVRQDTQGRQRAIAVTYPGAPTASTRPVARKQASPTPVRHGDDKPWLSKLVGAAFIAALGYAGVTSYQRYRLSTLPAASTVESEPEEAADRAFSSTATFQCEGKVYCSEMRSLAEAEFYINHCPGTKMDGNGDGEPCESQFR